MDFQEYEKRERQLGKALFTKLGYYYRFSEPGSYSRVDGEYIDNNGKTHCFEIKVRNHSVDRYSTHLIEKAKLESLCEYQQTHQLDYINFFKEAEGYTAVVFDISHRIETWRQDVTPLDIFFTKSLPSHTAAMVVPAEEELKKVAFLSVEYGDLVTTLPPIFFK